MEWLTLWLKKIILLVLLAAFLDLILPNTNLQKYVKMVMGLIILLTILSPAFVLFNISPDELAVKISRYQDLQPQAESNPRWREMADKLIGTQDQQMVAYATKQMETLVRAKLKEAYNVETATVDILFSDKQQGETHLQAIHVTLGREEQKSLTTSTTKQVQPIEPIHIEVGQDQAPTPQAEKAIPAAANEQDPLHAEIARYLAREFAIEPTHVHIRDEKTQEERQ